MKIKRIICFFALMLAFVDSSLAAVKVYKCVQGDKTLYLGVPCPESSESKITGISGGNRKKVSFEDVLLANVTPNCTMSGRGDVNCSFLNNTSQTASICVVVKSKRNKPYRYYKYSKYNKWTETVETRKICTGALPPNGLIERNASFAGSENDVNKLCRPRYGGDDWRDLCDMSINPVSK